MHVAPGGESDGRQAKHLIDVQPPERRPERVLGDTAYGNGPTRAELAEREVQVLAPVPEGTIAEERIGKREFEMDLNVGTITCPVGHTVAINTSKTGPFRVLRHAGEHPLALGLLSPATVRLLTRPTTRKTNPPATPWTRPPRRTSPPEQTE